MLNARKAEAIVIIILMIIVISISIGKGALKIPSNKLSSEWNVSFKTDSLLVTEGSVEKADTKVDSNNFSFTATFSELNDFYEASVKVENKGTIDAYLKNIRLTGLTEEQQKYLSYSITYGEHVFTDIVPGLNIKLPAKSEETLKIRVEYKNPYYGDEEKVEATVTLEFESE